MKEKGLAMDAGTARAFDENGYLHVSSSPLTKETVNPYYGQEIPGWRDLGLDPEKIYYGYRAGEELKKAVPTFNGLPLQLDHHLDSAENPQKEARVGSVGTSAKWEPPYITNALTVTDAKAIEGIESGECKDLSSAYAYEADFTPGVFEGKKYDFIMRDIRGNHVALVREGRAGPDVVVADSQITQEKKPMADEKDKKETTAKDADIPRIQEAIQRFADDLGKVDNPELAMAFEELQEALTPFWDEEAREDAHQDGAEDAEEGEVKIDTPEKQRAFAEGVKYGESLIRNPDERRKIDREHESEGMKKAMDKVGCDAEDPGIQAAFAEGVKYGERLERNPAERKKLDREHESEGAKRAMDAATISRRAEARTLERIRALNAAAREVRPLIGEIADPLAFDSAESIYKKALEAQGVRTSNYDRAAYKGMVDMLKNKMPQAAGAVYAMDSGSPANLSGPFKGLANIRVQ